MSKRNAIASTAILLDKRTQRKDGTYPVKLRITFTRIQKYYPTHINLTTEDYARVFGEKPRKEMKQLRLDLEAIEQKAANVIKSLNTFSFEAFETIFYNFSTDEKLNVFAAYQRNIERMISEGRIGNANSYVDSCNSIKIFTQKTYLPYSAVTANFLKEYEHWMVKNGRSLTTVGIYLRPLRALFNEAIRQNIVLAENYPFGKGKYMIPAGRNVKKALNLSDIEKIFHFPTKAGSTEQWAQDMWIFSYLCNGMNIKDIARLRYQDLSDETIVFIRSKTERTSRKNLKPVVAVLTPEAKAIIARWGSQPVTPNQFIFSILTEGVSPQREKALIHQATKQINKYVRRIAAKSGITVPVTTYTARHSFATVLKRSGAPMEFISESLGHSDMKTTENYLAAFESSVKKEYAAKLTAFNKNA